MIKTDSSKILIVTGSSRGIGAATAIAAGKAGYSVCINYLEKKNKAHEVAAQVRDLGSKCIIVQADMSLEADVIRLFHTVDTELGALSALVNNVGILMPQTTIEEMSAERINKILTTNITSQFLCCREAVKRMSYRHRGKGGAIVNVSSAASRLGSPGEYIDYAASKGAIDSLTIGLAKEVAGHGIRVNAVRPGFINTDIHNDGGEPNRIQRIAPDIPMKRGGNPEEVAEAILWLIRDKASYVTGNFLEVAGGR